MFTPRHVWIMLLLGYCFPEGGWRASPKYTAVDYKTPKPFKHWSTDDGYSDSGWGAFPAHTSIDCKTPTPFIYVSTNEGYSGTLEYAETPLKVSLTLESPLCPVCLSFLDLSHSPGDAYATVNTKKALDAEALRQHDATLTYTIVCTGSGVTYSRTLQLKDVNDNAPVFQKSMYRAEVKESLSVGSLVVQVKATDADLSSIYNTITYHIKPPSDTFEVSSDGSIVLKKKLNYAVTKFYSFSVTALDIDNLSGTTTVEVTVTGGGGGGGGGSSAGHRLAPARSLGLMIPIIVILSVVCIRYKTEITDRRRSMDSPNILFFRKD